MAQIDPSGLPPSLPPDQPVNPYAPPTAPINPYAPPGAKPAPIWNPDAAGMWSLFLTPVFGSVLLWLNWQRLGEDSRTGGAIGWILASVLMLVPSATIPGFALLWLIAWYILCQRKQSRYVGDRWGKNYPKRGWLAPLGIAFGSMVAVAFLLGLSAMMLATATV